MIRPGVEQATTTQEQYQYQYATQPRMKIRFTNTDSTGAPVTKELSVVHGGERYEIRVSENGTADVPEAVGEYLVDSDTHAIEECGEDDGGGEGEDAVESVDEDAGGE